MPENSVEISVSVPKGGTSGINVFVPGSTGEVTARDNLAQTYAEWARLWAIKLGDKVNGEDYSSKYYAQQSQKNATESAGNAQICKNYAQSMGSDFATYSQDLAQQSNEAFEEIELARVKALEEITEAGGGVSVDEFNELQQDVGTVQQDISSINVEIADIKTDLRNKKEVLFSVNEASKTLVISYKEEL